MCQRMGLPPTSTIGFGLRWVSSLRRVPRPPARITAFTNSRAGLLFKKRSLFCQEEIEAVTRNACCLKSGCDSSGLQHQLAATDRRIHLNRIGPVKTGGAEVFCIGLSSFHHALFTEVSQGVHPQVGGDLLEGQSGRNQLILGVGVDPVEAGWVTGGELIRMCTSVAPASRIAATNLRLAVPERLSHQ